MQLKEKKMIKKIYKLRTDKMSIGSLLRIVRGKSYENLSDDLIEIDQIRKRVPSIVKYIEHF